MYIEWNIFYIYLDIYTKLNTSVNTNQQAKKVTWIDVVWGIAYETVRRTSHHVFMSTIMEKVATIRVWAFKNNFS